MVAPRTWRMSSSYLRTTPSVSSTTSGSSSVAPSDSSAAAQSSVSATPGHLGEVRRPQPVDEVHDLAGQLVGRVGHAGRDDLELLGGRRVVDPVVQAAALERVVDLAGPVRRQHDLRGLRGADGPDLGDRDLEVGQDLEQVGLELLVRPVDLVDQQHRRHPIGGLERLEQGPLEQELGAEDVVGRRLVDLAARFEQPDLEHLARVVPLVDRGVDVQALVALEADEPRPERCREHLRELRLADARLALEQQRAAELEREEHRRRQGAIGDVAVPAEGVGDRLDAPGPGRAVLARGGPGGRGRGGVGMVSHGGRCYTGRRPRRVEVARVPVAVRGRGSGSGSGSAWDSGSAWGSATATGTPSASARARRWTRTCPPA